MRGFRLGLPAAAAILAVALLVAPAVAQVPKPDDDPFYDVPAGVEALRDGEIIRSREIQPTAMSIPMPARAWQVLYRTVDNTGAPTATVTTIMVPNANWTGAGPRPLLSYQTAEDGAGTKCAPSYAIRAGLAASSNSSGETFLMMQALERGWTVVAPDYQGPRSMFLGAEGEARGVLDGLRAARSFAPAGIDPGARTALWGYSGGAFASSVAAQMQPRHAPELELAGVALGGIPADVKETIRKFSGTVFGGALVMGFVTVDRAYPEYGIKQYLNERAYAAMARSQEDCINDAVMKHPFGSIEAYQRFPGALDTPALQPMFAEMSPLTFPGTPDAPVYAYHAVNDELAPIGPARELVERFCRAGVPVQRVESAIDEHITLVPTGAPGALAYLSDRFAGKAAPNNCGVPPDPPTTTQATGCRGPKATIRRARLARRRLALSGTAAARCGASASPSPVARVAVSVARLVRGRCQFVSRGGRLQRLRPCSRPTLLRARGARRWSLTRPASLRAGRYRIEVRAIDRGGRVSSGRNRAGRTLRVS